MSSPSFKNISHYEYQNWFTGNFQALNFRSPFHHPAWLETVAKGVGFEDVYIGIYQGNNLIAVFPGFLTRRGPFRLFGSPLRGTMTSYLGLVSLLPFETLDERLDLIMGCTRFVHTHWGASYTRFTLRNAPREGLPDLATHWEHQRPRSYRLNLGPGASGLWKLLKSDCRRNINRAKNAGIEIVQLNDPRLFFRIIQETFRRHQSTSWHSERFFQLIFENLIPEGILWAWGAKYNDETIAVGLFLHDNQEIHFISGASLPKYGSLPTSYLLHWHAIETSVRCALKVFNSDASQIVSIDHFKESFRPFLEDRFTLVWAPPHVRLAQKIFLSAYSSLRQIRRGISSTAKAIG